MTNDAEPLTDATLADLPGIRHGFFTRRGGVSAGIFAALNCGQGSGDRPTDVIENRARAARSLGAEPDTLISAYQVHSAQVAVVDSPWTMEDRPQVDGMATRTPGLALGILTADCAPVLFADADAGVIAAAHAGWRGALNGVLEETVAVMERLGAQRNAISAAVGPTIGAASYEVGPEFPAPFLTQDGDNARHFSDASRAGHYMFDLPGYVRGRLDRLDLDTIRVLDNDTCAEEDMFFSYRRATLRGESDYGRNLSALVLSN